MTQPTVVKTIEELKEHELMGEPATLQQPSGQPTYEPPTPTPTQPDEPGGQVATINGSQYYVKGSTMYEKGFRTPKEYQQAQVKGATQGLHSGKLVSDDSIIITDKSGKPVVRYTPKQLERVDEWDAIEQGRYRIPVKAQVGEVLLTPRMAEDYSKAETDRERFNLLKQFGVMPREVEYRTPAQKEQIEKSYAASEFELRQFKKQHTKLPDGNYISNYELNKTKRESPYLYDLLTTKGFNATDQYIDKQNRAITKLAYVTDSKGFVDGARYLIDHPRDRKTLLDAGFTVQDIADWRIYNAGGLREVPKPEKVSLPKALLWTLTPWSDETGQTIIEYGKEIIKPKEKTQQELKSEYEAFLALPWWERIISEGPNIVKGSKGQYIQYTIGYPPPVTPAKGGLPKGAKIPKIAKATKAAKVAEKTKKVVSEAKKAAKTAKVPVEPEAIPPAALKAQTAKKAQPLTTKVLGPSDVGMDEAQFARFLKARANNPSLTPEGFKIIENLNAVKVSKSKVKVNWDLVEQAIKNGRFAEEAKKIRAIKALTPAKAASWARGAKKLTDEQLAATLLGRSKDDIDLMLSYLSKKRQDSIRSIMSGTKVSISPSIKIAVAPTVKAIPKTQTKTLQKADIKEKAEILNKMAAKIKTATQTKTLTKTQAAQATKTLTKLQRSLALQEATKLANKLQTKTQTQTELQTKVLAAVKPLLEVQQQEKLKQALKLEIQTVTKTLPMQSVEPQLKQITTLPMPPSPVKPPGPGKPPPTPPIKPPPKYLPKKPRIRLGEVSTVEEKEKRAFIEKVDGFVARRRGQLHGKSVWLIDFYPYGPKDKMVLLGTPPKGIQNIRGKGSLQRSAVLLYGVPPSKPYFRNTGAVDDIISARGKQIQVISVKDKGKRII